MNTKQEPQAMTDPHEPFRVLHEKYPNLVPESFRFECGPGWIDLLDRYFGEVQEALPAGLPFHIRQIKEKFGGLRLYCEPEWPEPRPLKAGELNATPTGFRFEFVPAETNEVDEKLAKARIRAEARALSTCQTCGKPGRLGNKGGYLFTACDEHSNGSDPISSQEDWHALGKQWRYDMNSDDLIEIELPADSNVESNA